MDINFACLCGNALRVSAADAGLPVFCPVCLREARAPGEPLRPWISNEYGKLLSIPDELPLNDPENPLAFVGPGEMARTREQQVRATQATDWLEPTPGRPAPRGIGLGLLMMAGSLAWGFGWWYFVGFVSAKFSVVLVIGPVCGFITGLVTLAAGFRPAPKTYR